MSKRNTPQRRHAILALLNEQGEVVVDALAQHFATSEVTIRKDLAELEKNGLLLRRYGGAVPMPQELIGEPAQPISRYKQAIARAAVGLIREGQAGTDPERIREGMSGNLCRCGAYAGILDAVRDAAARTSEQREDAA